MGNYQLLHLFCFIEKLSIDFIQDFVISFVDYANY